MPLVDISNPACALPEILILDASILLKLYPTFRPAEQRLGQVIAQFFKRLNAEALVGRTMCVVPVMTLEECYFKIIQNKYREALPSHKTRLREQLGRGKITWNDLYKDSPQFIPHWMSDLKEFREAIISGIPAEVIEPESLVPSSPSPPLERRMLNFIEQVPILPKDAYLLAIAERLGVPHIATLDTDFKAATGWLHVYTYWV